MNNYFPGYLSCVNLLIYKFEQFYTIFWVTLWPHALFYSSFFSPNLRQISESISLFYFFAIKNMNATDNTSTGHKYLYEICVFWSK
jgi:hypothetical protein